jgi:hypothetical protein
MRLYVLVEGQTEEAFVEHVLGPHLHVHGWDQTHATLVKTKRTPTRHHGGGMVNWDHAARDLRLLGRSQHGNESQVVAGL